MKIATTHQLVILLAIASMDGVAFAFSPALNGNRDRASSVSVNSLGSVSPSPTFNQRSRRRRLFQNSVLSRGPSSVPTTTTTTLKMAAEDFNEAKYTEAAWSAVAALTKVADFYQASNVEAPFLLDVMLNPDKHNAGENAEAAKKVVEKILNTAGVKVKDLRSELESYLSKQVRVSNNEQKAMGRNLSKVLETARIGQNILGVSFDNNTVSFKH